MKPDLSYILVFPIAQKSVALKAAAELFGKAIEPDSSVSYADVGPMHVWLNEVDANFEIELWATTSSAGQALLKSREFRFALLKLLEESDGNQLLLDHSNGYVENVRS